METNYNKLLYEKMQAENETFKDWLLSQEPAEILNHAYEYGRAFTSGSNQAIVEVAQIVDMTATGDDNLLKLCNRNA